MLRALTALTVVAAVVAAPASAAANAKPARPKLHQVARNVSWFVVDGGHYAAWGRDGAGSFTVLDTRTHKRRHFALDGGCTTGGDRAMVGGRLLVYCGDFSSLWQLLVSMHTGRAKRLPGGVDSWNNLGTRWVEGTAESGNVEVYLNRRTGHIRRFRARRDSRVRDLDDPKLRVVCGNPGFLFNSSRFYDRRYQVAQPENGPSRLVIRRRCARTSRVLDRGNALGPPFLAAGWVSWTKGRFGLLENLRTRKRWKWRVPHFRADIGYTQSGQTRQMLFFAPVQTEDDTSSPLPTSFDVYGARL
ncbi:MAG: hypothetical protein QOF69_241 [Solirubrobacteraceae bacterium]|nr:hypothetical protein [Solirubrobacteraceae bacterium]